MSVKYSQNLIAMMFESVISAFVGVVLFCLYNFPLYEIDFTIPIDVVWRRLLNLTI